MILGEYKLKYHRDYQGARVFFNEAITSYPDSAVAERARGRLDHIATRMSELGLTFDEDGKLTSDEEAPEPTKKRKKFLGLF